MKLSHGKYGKYEYRGDVERRRARRRRIALLIVAIVGSTVAWKVRAPSDASAEPATTESSFSIAIGPAELRQQLEAARGERDLANAQLERANKIIAFSSRYNIAADLAGAVLDASSAEGIEPELAFRLVRVESEFNPKAVSPVGAIGLTQLMLPTARFFDPKVTREKLYDPATNLRIGFRYLRTLIEENDGDVKLALLVYNRGPVAVQNSRKRGINPSNGYDRVVTKGYAGTGKMD